MAKDRIVKIVFALSVDKAFDYLISRKYHIECGCRVLVDFNHRKRVGMVVGFCRNSKVGNLKPVIKVLDITPSLSNNNLRFAKRLSRQYLYSWGEMVFMMLPPYLRRSSYPVPYNLTKNKFVPLKVTPAISTKVRVTEITANRPLTGGQDIDSLAKISFIQANNFLERFKVYKNEIRTALYNCSVILCFPTLSFLNYVRNRIDKDLSQKIVCLNSYQGQRNNLSNWLRTKEGKVLLMGTRGILFYYPPDLGLIIVEEESSPYYFHPEKPYYHLADVALSLCRFKKIKLILSGSYPSLGIYKQFQDKKIYIHQVSGEKNNIEILNFSQSFYRQHIFTPFIIELMRKNLEQNRRILILWSKSKFSSLLRCNNCGYVPYCKRCSSPLKFSLSCHSMVCSWCGYEEFENKICTACGKGYLKPVGVGIERLKSIIKKIFPELEVKELENSSLDAKIILSTSKIVGYNYIMQDSFDAVFVLDVDNLISRIDYNAALKVFIYLKRIASMTRGKVYVFTHNPRNYLWDNITHPWIEFYSQELAQRKKFNFPPYGKMVRITLRSRNKNSLLESSKKLSNSLKVHTPLVFGPLEEFPFKLRNNYRYSVVAKFKSQRHLNSAVSVVERFRHLSTRLAVVIER